MKFRLWPRREPSEPTAGEGEAPPPTQTAPEPAPAPPAPVETASPPAAPVHAAPSPAETSTPPADEPDAPAKITLTIDEAKGVIREAGGDVIQVGFLASAYRRHLEEDPGSSETAASRKRLRELVSKRLKDRGLLAPDGVLELREEPAASE
jgi:hypothetical protein